MLNLLNISPCDRITQTGEAYFDVDAPGPALDTGWHSERCFIHILMAAALFSVAIEIHFSHTRQSTRSLSNRLTLGSDESTAFRSSTGWAFLALWQGSKQASLCGYRA